MQNYPLNMHSIITPAIMYWGTPVVLITTENEDGSSNIAPMSSAWWLGHRCVLGLAASSQTTQNLLRTKHCVLNLPSDDMASFINAIARTTGTPEVPPGKQALGYEYCKDKFKRSGLSPQRSDLVRPSRILECPVQMESELINSTELMQDSLDRKGLVLALEVDVLRTHVRDDLPPSFVFPNQAPMMLSHILSALGTVFMGAMADSTFTPARPPAIPLAVKSPYLSVWQNAAPQTADGDQEVGGAGNGGYIAGEWSTFWPSKTSGAYLIPRTQTIGQLVTTTLSLVLRTTSALLDPRENALFSIGLAQDEAIQFDSASGNVSVPSLWTSYFADAPTATEFFMNDYATALSMGEFIDQQIQTGSVSASGQDYATYTNLAYRQAFAGLQICNTPDAPYVFLKEISSDDDIQTVDVIFPMHPVLLYMNATWLKWTLDPLFINQESGQYPHSWSMHDLGSTYPNATGHQYILDEYMSVEKCGSMLIMTLGYAQRANDSISTDDFAGSLANQTNLAIKGIIGIQAMSKIANLTGNYATGANYSSIAATYLSVWQEHGITSSANPPHSTLAYNNETSYNLLYNLWADKALALNLVPDSIYDIQSTFYSTVFNEYGVYLGTRHTYTKVAWEALVAAIASSDVQSKFFSAIATCIGATVNAVPLTDDYDAVTGNWQDFAARPVAGGAFALLALP
ncbi:putative protein YdfE [Talaromyces islandicus]|uniref:Flavin reductase like domain-containing protein n=1 Tax=Talaromyces islandicus TaxID=28573 RepID=A0A0U1MA47_TALIS|nr:putative protein YdfE [Talaromyces islandicus]